MKRIYTVVFSLLGIMLMASCALVQPKDQPSMSAGQAQVTQSPTPSLSDGVVVSTDTPDESVTKSYETGNLFNITDCGVYITLDTITTDNGGWVNREMLLYELDLSPYDIGDEVELELDLSNLSDFTPGRHVTYMNTYPAVSISGAVASTEVSYEEYLTGMPDCYAVEGDRMYIRYTSTSYSWNPESLYLYFYKIWGPEDPGVMHVTVPSPVTLIPEQDCDLIMSFGDSMDFEYDIEIYFDSESPTMFTQGSCIYISELGNVNFHNVYGPKLKVGTALEQLGDTFLFKNDGANDVSISYHFEEDLNLISSTMTPSEWKKEFGDSIEFDVTYFEGVINW